MNNNKTDLDKRILNNQELNLSSKQKQAAIEKEQYYRDLYHKLYDLNTTKDFKQLANDLIKGYNNMKQYYNEHSDKKFEQEYIIKFAFRDFFLLLFINMNDVFQNSEFLKTLHKEVYFSEKFVNEEQFEQLIDYCQQKIHDESK